MKLPSLNTQILIAAIVGILFGWFAHGGEHETALYGASLVGTLFIDLLKMVLVPLVFCSIVVGIANLRQHQQMHRVWRYTLLFFISSMLVAIVIGLAASNLFKPGAGLHLAMFEGAIQQFEAKSMSLPDFFASFLHGLFMNPFKALAEGQILAVVMFALLSGIALVMGGAQFDGLRSLFEQGLALSMRLVGWIMQLAPLGVGALLFKLVAQQDVAILQVLARFAAVVVGSTLLHGLLVLPLVLWLFTRHSPLWLWRGAREALVTAFATSSSSATLPVTLRCVTQHLHVKPEIAGFVIPLGATINMDGTALYEAAAALFIAQLAGVDLNLVQQLVVCFTAMIAGMGAPGIPSAGMVTMVMVLQSVGLPAEAIAILLPIDRLLDTLRTTVNVEGDMVGSLVVQHMTAVRPRV
ncbi:dicarboxylate/amino acid:cation symporter [Methylophilus sp. TWE2]|uniref:dicarboxylate/amino acid:cation symporter n=1 Tax=Methylophilus sp. TWE2 TaxID=1662285 RepID=UPI0006712C66|nr:dicarboxylate/amino acid:cation symporter [Methylophilus sp. TWE2]AKR44761.1 glutamate:proton symporter [Methylophilus sp. TWE2]